MMKRALTVVMLLAAVSFASVAHAEDVYVSKNGKRFHREACKLIQNKETAKLSLEEAGAKGLKPCQRCFKDQLSANITDATQSSKSKKAVN